ncbi:Ca-activated chloride channel family protein [Litoreibacter halocynthiae]|uniref:Ca-activated chloride channel family protein n=1 Tax=Litoreibacter halocynthiae TaxID=1242689 RepID=A0A4R7LHZ8_9RHOB|nr:VIT and VWA domain-containing protein [Litoreibacter halocynthiae]TDT74212.1 Ca-activated chloride channel family protein [Litoreibacter halocynthiae]
MRLFFILIPIFSLSAVFSAFASDTDEVAGRVIANVAGTSYDLPMLDSKISVNIEGDMATVEVTQSFINEAHVPVEAEYLFPLNQLAAVYSMDMLIGDEVIKAKIREKAVAEAEFKKAAQDGKAAALLTQHRPNMFTQSIANLMPGLPITVTLRYVQMVPKIDGQHELVIPLIVGPRYESAAVQLPDEDSEDVPMTANSWTISDVPAYPQVVGLDLPDTFTSERVALDLTLTGGVSISDFGSDTHQLAVQSTGDGLTAKFAKGKVLDNRDLVIRFTLGGETLEAASLSHTDERGGFVSLMIEPPAVPDAATITPRELVFVLDTSGSMGGQPMAASKRFMDAALRGMRPTDYFRIIPFANHTQNFSSVSKQATARNIRSARAYVDKLSTGGGTEIDNAIRTAFSTPQPENTMKIVVFLSDGYIGGEAQVLRTIRQRIGNSRIYAFGVGTSVNRYLLDAMADEGRGYARYVGVDEDAYEVAETLAADLKSPLLTDISIDWGDLDVTDVTPSRLPDLFAGNSLRIYARHSGTGAAEVTLKGLVQGRQAAMPVKLTLTDNAENAALPLIWARNRIASLTRQIAVGEQPEAADKEITKLGLEFSLQTQNTSFVAVSEQTVNTSGHQATLANVPLPMVSGVSKEAYPQPFAGSSSPEPQAIIGFLLIAAMTLFGFRRRVR